MIKKTTIIVFFTVLLISGAYSQNKSIYRLKLELPIVEASGNFELPQKYPTMNEALKYSKDFYEMSYWGIDETGNRLFNDPNGEKLSNFTFKYIIGLAFAKYISELPIPLGVWGHEEYHRAVLGNLDISSKNGNWLFTRWDGTVFGVSDQELSSLKQNNLSGLLYSYVSGIQYESDLSRHITIDDFFQKRTLYKNSLILYNAWYVYDYFRFSTSNKSDSVKVKAPDNESSNPLERDFAGADLTAWVYDMFNPDTPYTNRDAFPEGEGVNRRIGFTDLSPEAGDYLKRQKNLSLLNFLNPAIFFINRIEINNNFSFTLFTQYAPTHFGNDIAVYFPFKLKENNLLINIHRYSNKDKTGLGLGAGAYNLRLSDKIEGDIKLDVWNQPETFFSHKMRSGGYLNLESRYHINKNLAIAIGVDGKTKGWMIGEPSLKSNISVQAGFNYQLSK
ncbi:MAG: hypothetical protein ACM3PR_10930 [Bacteroidales bacterium]|jgi:hypothetical protein